jgi:Protein of unknown function (DUF2934)
MAKQTGAVDADRVRQRAFELWEQDGRPEGRDMDYWFRAEAELTGQGASGLETPAAGGASYANAGARGEPDVAAPGKAGASRPRGQGAAGGGKKSATRPEPALAEERGEYVQQRRSRKKAEG